jgi:hypothetical protein
MATNTSEPALSTVQPKDAPATFGSSGNGRTDTSGAIEYVSSGGTGLGNGNGIVGEEEAEGNVAAGKRTWFAYVKTKQFWVVLVLGQGELPFLALYDP